MTVDERLQYCRICLNRKMNPTVGLICSLTDEKPQFDPSCPSFSIDESEAARLLSLENAAEKEAEEEENLGGFFGSERFASLVGLPGGIVMLLVGAVAFFFPEKGLTYYTLASMILGIIVILKTRKG